MTRGLGPEVRAQLVERRAVGEVVEELEAHAVGQGLVGLIDLERIHDGSPCSLAISLPAGALPL